MNVGILELLAYSLAHDAAHGALVPGRRLNALIYVLIFGLQGVNASLWKLRHLGSHHVFPNGPRKRGGRRLCHVKDHTCW